MKSSLNLVHCLLILLIVSTFSGISYAYEIKTTSVLSKEDPGKSSQKDHKRQSVSPVEDREKGFLTEGNRVESSAEAEEISAIEQYISGELPDSVSTEIKQFGYDLFRQQHPDFKPETSVPVGPDYVVGPEDEVKITLWGKVDGNWDVTVDRDGNIALPKIGVIGVAGLTFNDMKEALKKEISRYYTGFKMNVTMGSLRTIRVYVVGNAKQPGAYTVSSLSSLISALFEAGGPSKTGSMRDIQLKRNGATIANFDLYDLLLRGDKKNDLRLQSEDVIFIPPIGSVVGIAGNVKRPAVYELKNGTRLFKLIDMAGGLTSIAFKGRIQVQRIDNHESRILFEGDLLGQGDQAENNFPLKDGDLVKVFAVNEHSSSVTLSGAVAAEGEYAVIPGKTRIKDLIEKAGGLLYYSSTKAELTRLHVKQSGAETEFINIDISKALSGDPEHNIPMETNDYLFVRTIPEWGLFQTVEITGEVKYPGNYTIKKGETLSSLIERAGGYTSNSYLRGAVFLRERVREMQQQSIAQMAERLERELFSESSMGVSTAISQEEISAKQAETEQKKEFIETLKKVEATGRMSILLSHLRLLKGSDYDIELEEGDTLYIPKKNSVVNVLGSVMSRGSFVYTPDLDYKDYIGMAGGYTKHADKSSIYVLKVDGTAKKLSSGLFNWSDSRSRWELKGFDEQKEIEPGDSIVVPEKLERIAWMRQIKDISQILYQIAVATAVVIDIDN